MYTRTACCELPRCVTPAPAAAGYDGDVDMIAMQLEGLATDDVVGCRAGSWTMAGQTPPGCPSRRPRRVVDSLPDEVPGWAAARAASHRVNAFLDVQAELDGAAGGAAGEARGRRSGANGGAGAGAGGAWLTSSAR